MAKKLTDKQLKFCKEYVFDWNRTKAAIRAGYSEKTAYSIGSENMKKPEILAEIETQKNNLEELAGVSKLMAIKELHKFAFQSFDEIHDSWIERKEFNALSKDVKSCIQEIDTKILKKNIGTQDLPEIVDVEHIKVKFVDKRGALQDLAKLLGWNNAEKVIQTNVNIDATELDKEERKKLNNELEDEF